MKIQSFLFGNRLLVLDNNNEFQNFIQRENLYLFNHPTDDNILLISDKTKREPKDSIALLSDQVTEVGGYPVIKPSRAVLTTYLLRTMVSTTLDQARNLDGFELQKSSLAAFSPDLNPFLNDGSKPHYFNANDAVGVSITLEDQLEDDFVFRITNGGKQAITLVGDYSASNYIIKGDDQTSTQQEILAGETVEVSFNFNRKEYSLVSLSV